MRMEVYEVGNEKFGLEVGGKNINNNRERAPSVVIVLYKFHKANEYKLAINMGEIQLYNTPENPSS